MNKIDWLLWNSSTGRALLEVKDVPAGTRLSTVVAAVVAWDWSNEERPRALLIKDWSNTQILPRDIVEDNINLLFEKQVKRSITWEEMVKATIITY